MKKNVIILLIFSFSFSLYSTIASGTEPGSFFYSNMQYSSIPEEYRAVFYSPDHGETIIRRHFYQEQIHKNIMSDAAPGVLYLYNRHTFEVSCDFGATWEFVYVPGNNILNMSTGNKAGEVYKWDYGFIYYSTDFGFTYTQMSEILGVYYIVGGVNDNELFYVRTDAVYPPSNTYYIGYSIDNGLSFTEYIIDSNISDSLNFNSCVIHRGTNSGELYLVALSSPCHYKIYFSIDYGQNFELKYIGEEFDMAVEDYAFASGNEPGSFYMFYLSPDIFPDQVNSITNIYHSTDYGETFTEEYYHYFDDTFENPDYVIAYPNEFEVNGEAGSLEFNLASNVNWSVESDSDWITSIIPSLGAEDGSITLEYSENLSSSRTAVITIQSENTEDVITIWQETNVSADENVLNISNSKLNISNYPNPFYLSKSNRSNSTTISYDLPYNIKNYVIEIFNVKGQCIRELRINNSELKIGKATWDGTDQHRKPVSSGVYLYRVKADDFVSKTARMLILK
ncbi:MAG: hypothetical protein B7C24_18170 [Bacteroidetes bacterium 4572_77]|nr:MAG: hypothetical protein B7C24_18170 [Bacteroidetes bacterium 4572_77]